MLLTRAQHQVGAGPYKVAGHAAKMGPHGWPPESGRGLRATVQTHMPAARSRYMTARSVAATGCTVIEPMMPAGTGTAPLNKLVSLNRRLLVSGSGNGWPAAGRER